MVVSKRNNTWYELHIRYVKINLFYKVLQKKLLEILEKFDIHIIHVWGKKLEYGQRIKRQIYNNRRLEELPGFIIIRYNDNIYNAGVNGKFKRLTKRRK